MSVRRLPREMGIWITCNGTDTEKCSEKRFTANIYAKVNRADAAKHGWGRGLRTNKKRRDLCPPHLQVERELLAKQKAAREAKMKLRDEQRKAKALEPKPPKKPRKRKMAAAEAVATFTVQV